MSTLYQIYHESVVRLVATLVVKDTLSCEIVNSRLQATGHEVDLDNPRSWKYYLHLAGQYHPTDEVMTVTSMDTHETIDFTVENMAIHRATWREYQYGTRYYKELKVRYPQQDILIHGILNPVDIDYAIEAADHTILWYDPSLVEARETNLIPELSTWIKGQFIRWDSNDYRINNAYFVAAKLAVLFMALPSVVKSIRLGNARTNRVHSYHIRRYLASFGPLDKHYDAMNEFQRLYFYRNIRYLLRNNGKNETFDELIKNVMTRRSLPVASYNIQLSEATMPTSLDPGVQYERKSINNLPSAMGEDIIDTPTMLELQRRLATGNVDEIPYAEEYVPEGMKRSLSSELTTKVLESNVLDRKESEPYTLTDVLFNHWLYFADRNLYHTVLVMQLPDGGDGVRLSMKEAWLVWQYLYFKRSGIELTTIPKVMAKRVRRIIPPTFEELRPLARTNTIPDSYIKEALKDNVRIDSYVSVDAFLKACIDIRDREKLHRDLYLFREDLFQYAEMRTVVDRFYADIPVDMDNGQVYSEWLNARGLSFDKYTPAELDEILLGILNQATGIELRTAQTLKDVQVAMLGIMGQLSSYSVHFIQEINEEALMTFGWPHIRYHYLGGRVGHDIELPVTTAVSKNLYGTAKPRAELDIGTVQIRNFDHTAAHDMGLDIGLLYRLSGMNQYLTGAMNIGPVVSTITADPLDLSTLTNTSITVPTIVPASLSDLFDRTQLDDFNHP